MPDLSHVRLFIRIFSVVWYVWCGLGILFGLFMFLCGLAALLDLNLFGTKFAEGSGPGFLGVSLAAIAILVVFIFVPRYFFRRFLAQLNELEKRRQTSTDSNSPSVMMPDEPSDGTGDT